MHRLGLLLALLATAASAAPKIVVLRGVFAPTVAAPSLDIDENCEGTGAPAGWTLLSGAANWDYSASPITGAESVQLGSSGGSTYYAVADSDYREVIFAFRTGSILSGTRRLVVLATSEAAEVCSARVNGTGNLIVFANGVESTPTTDAISGGTPYYIRLIFQDSGTCSVEFSSSLSFAGSGTKYASTPGGTTTTLARVHLGWSSGSNSNGVYDAIRSSSSPITP
jgi:hypothetical protein